MGQKPSTENQFLTTFDKDTMKCVVQAARDRLNWGKEGTDDRLQVCLLGAMDQRPRPEAQRNRVKLGHAPKGFPT
jgi:hypothetical protein